MKSFKLKNWRYSLQGAAIFLFIVSQLSCGSGAPPLQIPAPVSTNIRVTSPNGGNVTVSGTAVDSDGTVHANETVKVTNTSVSPSNSAQLMEFFIPSAHAQISFAISAETTSDASGVFSVEIAASVGDALEVVTVNSSGTQSSALSLSVTADMPSLTFTPKAVVVDGSGTAYVVGASIVAIVNISTKTVTSTFDSQASDPKGVAYDAVDNELLITDQSNNRVVIIPLNDTGNPRFVNAVTGAESIAIDTATSLAVVGTTNTAASVVLIDLASETISNSAPITNVDNAGATYLGSPGVDAGGQEAVFASNFSDSSAQVTQKNLNPAVFGNQQAFSNSAFRGISRFGVNQAMVADQTNDRVLVIDTTGAAASRAITVGDSPEDVSIDTTNDRALVTNFSDNTVSVINLQTLAVTATSDVGLGPTKLDFDASIPATIVVNEGNNSVSIIQ